jgi:four helix bundle protein
MLIQWEMIMTDFKQLKEWDKAHNLTVEIYKLTQAFPESEILGLTQQIRLASAAIPIKIAQGCDREEKEDRLNFLQLATDAAIELEYYLLLCYELELIEIADYDRIVSSVVQVKELLTYSIQKLKFGNN